MSLLGKEVAMTLPFARKLSSGATDAAGIRRDPSAIGAGSRAAGKERRGRRTLSGSVETCEGRQERIGTVRSFVARKKNGMMDQWNDGMLRPNSNIQFLSY
jgi:hypothetical protein